ncbi:MAG: response regulator [Treponema sp.]|nr:response regulator [Treponema sp.]
MDELNKNKLLIVDDEKLNLKVLTNILSSEYSIITATNGRSAIEKAQAYSPDLILLDILMPEMDGYQTLAEIKACKELQKIPVIFITGLDSEEHEEKGLALEAADYITKPFSASIVKLRVRNQIQLKSAVVAAESANRSKSAFLAKMSHEIRTPLNAILGISAIQLQNETHSQEVKDSYTKIFNSGDLLLGIINDILDMSKIEAGKLELLYVKYNVAQMINDTVFLNLTKYENKPIEFILNVDENVPSSLIGDEIRIKQILNNLLSNAFKYTSSGEVELSISYADAVLFENHHNPSSLKNIQNPVTLIINVRDTGQGMTEEQVSKLFDEYSRFNLESNKDIEGTGLGMSILHNLINMMNGDIHAQSEPGKGSLFTVRLPQGSMGAAAIGKETAEKLHEFRSNIGEKTKKTHIVREHIRPGKVLIVDDVDINLYVAKEMLLPYGLEIDLASSGAEAIESIKKVNYDIIFMDHIMPLMDGIETTKEIRRLGYDKLPIIALTANAVSGVKEMFLDNGFNGFVSKPIGLHELDEILKEWMLPGTVKN